MAWATANWRRLQPEAGAIKAPGQSEFHCLAREPGEKAGAIKAPRQLKFRCFSTRARQNAAVGVCRQ